jgi:hypothetical protein
MGVHHFRRTHSLRPNKLWLFTDLEATQYARDQGVQLGTYATGMRGVEIFEYLPPGITTIHINPVSVAEFTWTFPESAIAMLQGWTMAVRFEEDVLTWRDGIHLDRFRSYPQFQVFVFPDRSVLTMPKQFGMENPAIVCSSPDSTRDILRRVPVEMQNQLQMAITTGAELLEKLPEQNMDGLVLNPIGPGPQFAHRFGAI